MIVKHILETTEDTFESDNDVVKLNKNLLYIDLSLINSYSLYIDPYTFKVNLRDKTMTVTNANDPSNPIVHSFPDLMSITDNFRPINFVRRSFSKGTTEIIFNKKVIGYGIGFQVTKDNKNYQRFFYINYNPSSNSIEYELRDKR